LGWFISDRTLVTSSGMLTNSHGANYNTI